MADAEQFDDQLLQEYMRGFYGYGNYAGRYWFVGMEEGGEGDFQDVNNKLQAWRRRGGRETEDLVEFHRAINVTCFMGPRVKLQATWSMLIRVKLSIEGKKDTPELVRSYQANDLARKDSDTCLLELLPLPSKSVQNWSYTKWSRLPSLTNRKTYTEEWGPTRAAHLKQRIEEHQPLVVVFYSTSYQWWWSKIAGVPFARMETHHLYIGNNGPTLFVMTRHPAYRQAGRINYFRHAGREISARVRVP